MLSVLQKPHIRPWILLNIAMATIAVLVWLLSSESSRFLKAVSSHALVVKFDSSTMVCPGGIVGMLFLAVMAYGEWKYHFHRFPTKKEQNQFITRISRLVGKGMVAAIILAFGASFLILNPLIERFYLTDNGYVRCPNQLQLSDSMFKSIWVKQQSWCFDKGFQKSLSFHSTIKPSDYLAQRPR